MWIVSLVLFITVDVVLGIFIDVYMSPPSAKLTASDSDTSVSLILRISRVILLESLILLMGLALGVFIIIVSTLLIMMYKFGTTGSCVVNVNRSNKKMPY